MLYYTPGVSGAVEGTGYAVPLQFTDNNLSADALQRALGDSIHISKAKLKLQILEVSTHLPYTCPWMSMVSAVQARGRCGFDSWRCIHGRGRRVFDSWRLVHGPWFRGFNNAVVVHVRGLRGIAVDPQPCFLQDRSQHYLFEHLCFSPLI